jgi:hypothetical protein
MSAQHTPGPIRVRISATIDNDYANRCPEWMQDVEIVEGANDVTISVARVMLADAEYNSDKSAFDIGPHDMPLGTFNAYRALAKQLRAAIAKATGEQA